MRTLEACCAAAVLAAAVSAPCAARATAPAPAPTRQQRLNALFHSLVQPNAPGAAVLVRYQGRTVFRRGYGLSDLRSAKPITPRTDFRLASCTKQFTAMAIMLLVQAGKLRYDEPLTEIFPHFPAYGARVTIRELLNHTSGLQSYGDWMAKKYANQEPWTVPQIHDPGVLRFEEAQTGTEFTPGTEWKYSNGGYCVLGMCIVRASGMSYPAYLRRHIFLPLGMDHSLAYVYGGPPVPRRAYGYTLDAGRWMESDQDPTSATLGDGGVYTSIADLTKWDRALYHHTLLSAAQMKPAITPPHLPGRPGVPVPIQGSGWGVNLQTGAAPKAGAVAEYGFGWFLNPWHGHARMWHEGETVGFRSVIMRFPKDRLSVMILANRVDLNLPQLAEQAAGMFLRGEGRGERKGERGEGKPRRELSAAGGLGPSLPPDIPAQLKLILDPHRAQAAANGMNAEAAKAQRRLAPHMNPLPQLRPLRAPRLRAGDAVQREPAAEHDLARLSARVRPQA